ncbi:phosphotriesterase [Microbacterium sp.]|uniref:phosphotriesterase family protein n=1 Tax=Microbacterium sp. TaxID=51671 RepID=UPI003A843AB0
MTSHLDAPIAHTVLGAVPADRLGIVAVHESLLSILPGAQYAPEITIDRAEVFDAVAAKLTDFASCGGGTIVDSTGMYHGRDLPLYEALSRATGVHIVASTGLGPEELLGGYFLTPQTNPPTPWPAERFAELFEKEAVEGMVVPRVERRAPAGLVTVTGTRGGLTATDESLVRAAARTARTTGIPASLRWGADAVTELDLMLTEGVPAGRVLVGDLDRRAAVAAGAPADVADRGAYVGLDHIGLDGSADHLTDRERAVLVRDLIEAGFGDRLLLSVNAIGVAKGVPAHDVPYSAVVSTFAPLLVSLGVSDAAVHRLLVDNPRDLLAVAQKGR